MFAVVSLLIVLSLSLLLGRIAALALTVTGIPRHVARFQARSALTGAGFTTTESEQIVTHPVRRRIVMFLMLAGNLGAAGLIGSFIGGFFGVSSSGEGLQRALLLVTGLLALFLFSKSPWADRHLSRLLLRLLRRYTDLEVKDEAQLLRLHGEYAVSELQVQAGDWIQGRTLGELDLSHEGVLVLAMVHPDGSYVGTPTGSDSAAPGDVLLLYGRESVICDLDERPAGTEGDQAHRAAVARQRAINRQEHVAAEDAAEESEAADLRG